MTEYWKSNPRKFCPQCKVWITDNKISVQFHESGKKHKENVAKQLSVARKRGADSMKEKKNLAKALEQIEKRARLAVMKDKVGIDEINDSSSSKNSSSSSTKSGSKKDVSEVNKLIYSVQDYPEDQGPKVWRAPTTGLGKWEKISTVEEVCDINPEELPETQNYAVKDNNTFEVKTAVIETLDIETEEGKSTGFKKRRARNIRKKTES